MSTAEEQLHLPETFWFIAQANTLKGPYTGEQLLTAIGKKEFSFSDFCWRPGFREWRPISSVPEFDRREKVQAVPSYPTVPPPVNETFQRDFAAATPTANRSPVPKTIRVSFARSPRQAISIYEWGAAIVFAVIFAYLCSSFAMNEVRQHILAHLELKDLGHAQLIGTPQHHLPPAVWQPLYSAPSLQDVAAAAGERSTLFQSNAIDFTLPITLYGQAAPLSHPSVSQRSPASTSGGHVSVGGFAIQNDSRLHLWSANEFDLDPVYSKPLLVRGYLSVHDGTTLQINEPGEPFLK